MWRVAGWEPCEINRLFGLRGAVPAGTLVLMWGRKNTAADNVQSEAPPARLRDAVRQARIETAERTSVVVDMRDAEVARLELLNEALDPLFSEIPAEIDLFDRGISRGDTPRLWLDSVAHVLMGRDKREYRLVQDTRYGRKVLAESADIQGMVQSVTHYVATRLVERERALSEDSTPVADYARRDLRSIGRRRRWRMIRAFLFGLILGFGALFLTLWIVASKLPPQ